MNNLTDRQKAAIYDDAVEKLPALLKEYNFQINCETNTEHYKSFCRGAKAATQEALDVLTENEFIEYLYEPTVWEKSADVGKSAVFGIGCVFAAFMLFQVLKFTFETFGLI